MRKLDNYVPHLAMQDSSSPLVISPKEVPASQNQRTCTSSIQFNMPQSMPQLGHKEFPQYEKQVSVGVNNETKDKIDET